MSIQDYIKKFESVNMIGRFPIEVYEDLLAIEQEYYYDTGDDCLGEAYCEEGHDLIQEDSAEILKNKGWKARWKFLHTIPESSIQDSYFRLDIDHLRPINWSDVAELQRTMIETLQAKIPQTSERKKLVEALDHLGTARNIIDALIDKEDGSETD